MALTDIQKKAIYKYREKIVEVRFTVPKDEKIVIKKHAEENGESVSAFVYRAVKETMARDKEGEKQQEEKQNEQDNNENIK